MAWFKVDDKYWSHPKVLITNVCATGVWLRAGTWSAQHLTDGRIPDQILLRIMPASATQVHKWARELEKAGLWLRDGEDWVFHDWVEYQPTAEAILNRRADDAERKRRGRDTQRHLRALHPEQ